jgi:glycosyltransferase involved in cell wall biosynthesis
LRILALTPFLPYGEARAGGPRAMYDRLRLLAGDHKLTVVTLSEPADEAHLADLAQLGIRVRAVSRATGAPIGWRRWWKRARLLGGLLVGRPLLVQEFHSVPLRRLIARTLHDSAFDIVLIEHILMAQYAPLFDGLNAPPVMLTDYDVRLAIPSAKGTSTGSRRVLALLPHRLDRAAWRRYAINAWCHAEAISVPTAEDATLLTRVVPEVCPVVVPFGLSVTTLCALAQVPRDEDRLLFIGNFDHSPNVDAARWLVEDVLPLICRYRPVVQLEIVGGGIAPEVRALERPGVAIVGEVPSVVPYLQMATVFLAPLRTGGGVRMKLIEALAAGIPIVTTVLGAQGLGAEPGTQLLVADDAVTFARTVARVLTDRSLRDNLSVAGRGLVCSPDLDQRRRDQLNRVLRTIVDAASRREAITPRS